MSTAASSGRSTVLPAPQIQADPSDLPLPSLSDLRKIAGNQIAGKLPLNTTTLLWGLPPQCEQRSAEKLVALLSKPTVNAAHRRQVEAALSAWLNRPEIDAVAAWEELVLLYSLPRTALLLDDALLLQLWERCNDFANVAWKDTWDDDPVRFQLLAVEVPLLMASYSATHGERLVMQAYAAWQELISNWLDEQGLPQGRYLPAMRPVLASWTRLLKRNPAALKAERRVGFVGLLRQTIRLTHGDGRPAFSDQIDRPFLICLQAGVELCRDREATALLAAALTVGQSRRATPVSCSPSAYSEAKQLAILRSQLSPQSPRVTVAFDEPACQLELSAAQTLLSGEWTAELTVDGECFKPNGSWEEVCRYEDEDVEYLELETQLGPQWILQRHIVLAREEGFVLLADAVTGDRAATMSYTSTIPLAAGAKFEAERETNEAWLATGSRRYLALPLALPEWRSDRPVGLLAASDDRLTLTTLQQGRNLFQPLLIPLAGMSKKADYTWRQLTVAEELAILPRDAAAAFRVQLGDRQWVVYRALTRGNRTFLGKNLTSEFFVGVFHRTGHMDAIMEVE
jgi:hypothetical protein